MKKVLAILARPQFQAVLLLFCMFVIGGLAGAAIERAREHRAGPPPRERGGPHGLPPEISQRLNLSAAQTTEIQAILDRHKPATDAVLGQFLPQLRCITDSVRSEIRRVLTVQQRAVFDRQPPYLIGGQAHGDFQETRPDRPDSTGHGLPGGLRGRRPEGGPGGPPPGGPPPGDEHRPPGPPPNEGGGPPPGGAGPRPR